MSGVSGFGAVLKRNGTAIAELTNIPFPELTAADINVSSHDSPNKYEEFVQGMKNGGVVAIEGNFLPSEASQAALLEAMHSGVVETYTIEFPTGLDAAWTFSGYVNSFSGALPYEDKITFSAGIKVTGKPTLAVGASNNLSALTGIEEEAGAALTFVPSFGATTYDYVASVNTASTWVKLTPTAADGVITVNGNVVATTVQSGEIALGAAGSLTNVEVIVTETGKVAKVYNITVARA